MFIYKIIIIIILILSETIASAFKTNNKLDASTFAASIIKDNKLDENLDKDKILTAYSLINNDKRLDYIYYNTCEKKECIKLARKINFSGKYYLWETNDKYNDKYLNIIFDYLKKNYSAKSDVVSVDIFKILEAFNKNCIFEDDDCLEEDDLDLDDCLDHCLKNHGINSYLEFDINSKKSIIYPLSNFTNNELIGKLIRGILKNSLLLSKNSTALLTYYNSPKFFDHDDLVSYAILRCDNIPFTMICSFYNGILPQITDTLVMPIVIESPKDSSNQILRLKFCTIYPTTKFSYNYLEEYQRGVLLHKLCLINNISIKNFEEI